MNQANISSFYPSFKLAIHQNHFSGDIYDELLEFLTVKNTSLCRFYTIKTLVVNFFKLVLERLVKLKIERVKEIGPYIRRELEADFLGLLANPNFKIINSVDGQILQKPFKDLNFIDFDVVIILIQVGLLYSDIYILIFFQRNKHLKLLKTISMDSQ